MDALSVESVETAAAWKMSSTCAPECAPTSCGMVTGAPAGDPFSKIWKLTITAASPGLKTPTFVRKPASDPALRTDDNTVRRCACERGRPGMYMPTVGVGAVEKRRLVTTSCLSAPSKENSTPPAEFGALKPEGDATMSSNARDSRGWSVNTL